MKKGKTLPDCSLALNLPNPKLFFSKLTETSGFRADCRFQLVFQKSCYIIDQSKLGIAQIEALDLIKLLYFASWELGSLEGFWGHWGSKFKPF